MNFGDSDSNKISLILIGNQFVGKTSLLTRFANDKFSDYTLGSVGN